MLHPIDQIARSLYILAIALAKAKPLTQLPCRLFLRLPMRLPSWKKNLDAKQKGAPPTRPP